MIFIKHSLKSTRILVFTILLGLSCSILTPGALAAGPKTDQLLALFGELRKVDLEYDESLSRARSSLSMMKRGLFILRGNSILIGPLNASQILEEAQRDSEALMGVDQRYRRPTLPNDLALDAILGLALELDIIGRERHTSVLSSRDKRSKILKMMDDFGLSPLATNSYTIASSGFKTRFWWGSYVLRTQPPVYVAKKWKSSVKIDEFVEVLSRRVELEVEKIQKLEEPRNVRKRALKFEMEALAPEVLLEMEEEARNRECIEGEPEMENAPEKTGVLLHSSSPESPPVLRRKGSGNLERFLARFANERQLEILNLPKSFRWATESETGVTLEDSTEVDTQVLGLPSKAMNPGDEESLIVL